MLAVLVVPDQSRARQAVVLGHLHQKLRVVPVAIADVHIPVVTPFTGPTHEQSFRDKSHKTLLNVHLNLFE
jgi:hypothetical protein